MAKIENGAKAEDGGGPFETFLRDVDVFFLAWCSKVMSLSGEQDRRAVMGLYAKGVRDAWHGATAELIKMYQRMEPDAQSELNRSVMISGMLSLVKNANDLLSGDQLASMASLLDLGTIIEKIKQFIQCILGCLGIHLCILDCLFALIDNLIGLFLGPVSREYAKYYFENQKEASEVRQLMQKERNLRLGRCSCGT